MKLWQLNFMWLVSSAVGTFVGVGFVYATIMCAATAGVNGCPPHELDAITQRWLNFGTLIVGIGFFAAFGLLPVISSYFEKPE